MASQKVAIAVGLVTTIFFSLFTSKILDKTVSAKVVDPSWPNAKELCEATLLSRSGDSPAEFGARYVGYLECVLFYSAFWLGQGGLVIGGWLAFKAATKWAAWQHVIRLDAIPGIFHNPIHELQYRNRFGTRLASKLLIGTLYNILSGISGYVVAKFILC
jgi:hypothetical protein